MRAMIALGTPARLNCIIDADQSNWPLRIDSAVATARTMEHGARKCEVWQGDRLVAKLDSHDLAD